MAPRCGKRRRRARNPPPFWLPLPRPCLRSLNMPGPPYYMPISPEMYLPPSTLPPSYFTKPMCHCANENFCTTSNCRNSTECLKMHPMFCPHGTVHEEIPDMQQSTVQEQQQNNDDQETSSNSDMNICPACGAHSNKQRTLSNKSNLAQYNQPRPYHKSKDIRTQDSFTSSHNLEQNNQRPRGSKSEIKNSGRNLASRDRNITTEFELSSPDIVLAKRHSNGWSNESCHTSFLNSQTHGNDRLTTLKKNHLQSPRRESSESTANVDDSENSSDRKESALSHTYRTSKNVIENELGCSSCARHKINTTNNLENHPNPNSIDEELTEVNKNLKIDTIHTDQLPDQLSNARNKQANKYSGCCFTGLSETCKIAKEIDTISKHTMEIPNKSITKSTKKSECGCNSGKTSSRSRKTSKCECSSNKKCHKCSSKSHKLSECECSSTKINHKTNSSKKSDCSCSSAEGGNAKARSSTKIASKKSNKNIKDVTSLSKTDVKQSSCQCKFPPAYQHLSCTGNFNDNCTCTNNISK